MNNNKNEIEPFFGLWVLWVCILLMVVLVVFFASSNARSGDTWPNEMPATVFDEQLWSAAEEAMREKYVPPKCFQVIETAAGASVCITEAEWMRLYPAVLIDAQ